MNKCVYIFLDHRKPGKYIYDDLEFNYEPIYVGKGNINRPKNHKYRINKNNRFYNKYKKITKITGKEPDYIIIKENINEIEANNLEIMLIRKIGRKEENGPLTNLTFGGEGSSGIKQTEEQIINRVLSLQKNTKDKRKNSFIEKSNKKHNNKYDYSLVDYVNMLTKVKIICPIHGIFEQTPIAHRNNGCAECAGNKKMNNKEFIEKAIKVHGDKYNYLFIDYKNNRTKVKIKCAIHGIFEQSPEHHLEGKGCCKCYGSAKKSTIEFIEQSIKKHGDKYNYSKTIYNGAFSKVKIICPIHGVFEQIAKNHFLNGYGCPKCGINKKKA